jgi:hypothetical protein
MSGIGKVAICGKGMTGLVLSVFRHRKKPKPLYEGICLDPGRVGQPWQTLKPEWIGTLDDWVELRHTEIARAALLAVAEHFDTPSRKNLT